MQLLSYLWSIQKTNLSDEWKGYSISSFRILPQQSFKQSSESRSIGMKHHVRRSCLQKKWVLTQGCNGVKNFLVVCFWLRRKDSVKSSWPAATVLWLPLSYPHPRTFPFIAFRERGRERETLMWESRSVASRRVHAQTWIRPTAWICPLTRHWTYNLWLSPDAPTNWATLAKVLSASFPASF